MKFCSQFFIKISSLQYFDMCCVIKVLIFCEMVIGFVCEFVLYVDEFVFCVDVKDKFNQIIFDCKFLLGCGLFIYEVGLYIVLLLIGV